MSGAGQRPWQSPGEDRWLTGSALAVATVLLGWALQRNDGTLSAGGMRVVIAVLALTVLALYSPRLGLVERWGSLPVLALCAVGVGSLLFAHLGRPPGMYLDQVELWPYRLRVGAAVLACGAALAARPSQRWWAVGLVVGAHLSLGAWVISASPNPEIDVYVFHEGAFAALARGESPWSITFPNIYGHTDLYGPGFATAERVLAGFPYPPLQALQAWLGKALFGDYRYAHLLAMSASGALLSFARPGRLGLVAAMLLLFTPRNGFVLEQGWTEPVVVCLFCLVVFAVCRLPALLPWALGLAMAVKQYVPLLAPLFLLFPRGVPFRARLRTLAVAAALAAALTVPALIWDPQGFVRSVLVWQLAQPFRPDALSFVAWTSRDGQPVLPLWLNLAVVPLGWALAAARAPRTASGLALSAALVFLLFVAFAKQAFCNYYFFVLGCLCCALAALDPEKESWAPIPEGTDR